MQVGLESISVPHLRLVIAAARTEAARPTGMAVGAVVKVPLLQVLASFRVVDPGGDVSKIVSARTGEAVAETQVSTRGDPQKTPSGAAGIGFRSPLVHLSHLVGHVGEAGVVVLERPFHVLLRENLELLEKPGESFLAERVVAARGRGDGREPNLVEAHLVHEMLAGATGIEGLRRAGGPGARPEGPVG